MTCLFSTIVFAGCADKNYALSKLCEGQVPAARGMVLSVTFAAERYPVAAIDRVQVTDDDGNPSAFVGAVVLSGSNQIEVYGPQVGRGNLTLWLHAEDGDDEADQVTFHLKVDKDVPMEPPPHCTYTSPSDGG